MKSFPEQANITPSGGRGDEPGAPGSIMDEWLEYAGVIWRRKWVVIVLAFLGIAIGVGYIVRVTPKYQSSSKLYVERRGARILDDFQGGVMTASRNYLFTQASLITSFPIINAAVEKLNVRQIKSFAGASNPGSVLRSMITAQVGEKDEIITVSVTSPFNEEAAILTNAIVAAYQEFHERKKKDTNEGIRDVLEQRKKRLQNEEVLKHRELIEYINLHTEIGVDGNAGDLHLTSLGVAQRQLQSSHKALGTNERQLNYLRQLADEPDKFWVYMNGLGIEERRTDAQIRIDAELAATKNELKILKDSGTEQLPRIRLLEDRRKDLAIQQEEEGRKRIATILEVKELELAALSEIFEQDRENHQAAKRDMLALTTQRGKSALLRSAWERLKSEIDILDTRISEINLDESTGVMNITLLESAKPAYSPIWPNRQRVIMIGLGLGCMAGIGLAFLLNVLDHRLWSAEDVAAVLPVPLLGAVAEFGRKRAPMERGKWLSEKPLSPIAEAYRSIRTAIYFGLPKERNKIIMVTSAIQEEGKSTLTSNLAISMAEAGSRTLIVDADFRRPMQAKYYGALDERGLSSLIAGRCKLSDAIVPTGIAGLDLLPVGPRPPNPSEILNSQSFSDVLRTVREQYDNVVIDTPPVLVVADARIMSVQADVTLLMVRVGRATRRSIEESVRAVQTAGGQVLGAVVNGGTPQSKYGYGYRYGYRYGYHYGYHYGYNYSNREDDVDSKPRRLAAKSSAADATTKRRVIAARPVKKPVLPPAEE